jgi:hypothetical protein
MPGVKKPGGKKPGLKEPKSSPTGFEPKRSPTGFEVGLFNSRPASFQAISSSMPLFVSANIKHNCYIACVVMMFATFFANFFIRMVSAADVEELRLSVRIQEVSPEIGDFVELYAVLQAMVLNSIGAESSTSAVKRANTMLTEQFMGQMTALSDKGLINGEDLHMDSVKTYTFCVWLCCAIYRIKAKKQVILLPGLYYSMEDDAVKFFCVGVRCTCGTHGGNSAVRYFAGVPRNLELADGNSKPALRSVQAVASAQDGKKRQKSQMEIVMRTEWGSGFTFRRVVKMEVSAVSIIFTMCVNALSSTAGY